MCVLFNQLSSNKEQSHLPLCHWTDHDLHLSVHITWSPSFHSHFYGMIYLNSIDQSVKYCYCCSKVRMYQFRVICAFFHMCLEYDACFFVRKQFHHEGIGIPAHHLVVIIMISPNLFYYNNQVVCWIFCTNWLYSSSQTTLLCSHYTSCFEFSKCYNSACH